MIPIQLKYPKANGIFSKNVLYKIEESTVITFKEEHPKYNDIVNLEYELKTDEYGIYAHEYRNPETPKEGGKSADIFACVVDVKNKKIYSTILDVKHNISAFSDNLYTDTAMLTAINNVRDFVKQIDMQLLHKESLFVYYKAEDYVDYERVGIATKNFDKNKFNDVAIMLEKILQENVDSNNLILLKLKNSLRTYENELSRLKLFAQQKIEIRKNIYDLEVFLLEEISDEEFSVSFKIASSF